MKNNWYWFVIIALVAVIVLQQSCRRETTEVITTIHDTIHDTIPGDTVYTTIKTEVPKYIYRDTGSVKWRSEPIDTADILIDYFSIYFYRDTAYQDSSVVIITNDSISNNKIVYRNVSFKNLRPTAIITTNNKTTIVKRDKLGKIFVGAHVGGSSQSFYDVGFDAAFQNKKWLFEVGNNLLAPQPNFEVRAYKQVDFSFLRRK